MKFLEELWTNVEASQFEGSVLCIFCSLLLKLYFVFYYYYSCIWNDQGHIDRGLLSVSVCQSVCKSTRCDLGWNFRSIHLVVLIWFSYSLGQALSSMLNSLWPWHTTQNEFMNDWDMVLHKHILFLKEKKVQAVFYLFVIIVVGKTHDIGHSSLSERYVWSFLML